MSVSVSILGCGLMGTALAESYLKRSVEVTVWNRSAEKCKALVEKGAKQAANFKQALSAGSLVIAVLRDYDAFFDLIKINEDEVNGRDFVVLMTGSPNDALSLQSYIVSRGGRYLDGAILAYPENIGDESTLINYSGDATVWGRHQHLLRISAGGARWIGSFAGAANVLDTALTGAFYMSSVGAFLEAATYASITDVNLKELENSAEIFIEQIRRDVRSIVSALGSGDFSTDQANIGIYVSALKTWRQNMLDAGAPARILSTNLYAMEVAVSAGHAEKGVAATYLGVGY